MNKDLYIIIGGQRCGTTYLYKLLEEHPQICAAKPLRPEPKFFLKDDYEKGLDHYIDTYFPHREEHHKIFVEKSTSYYESEIAAKRINSLVPNSKIIMILRDPVQRAISNYFFSKNNGLETRSLEDVFLNESDPPKYPSNISTNPFNYLKRGEYIKYIEMYLEHISEDRIHILFLKDIINNPAEIKGLYESVGVRSDFNPFSLNRRINISEKNEDVPEEVTDKLVKYYEPYNLRLGRYLNKTVFK
jgi:hypothetical protein